MQVDFEALFEEHGPWLLQVARSVTRRATDAEDVVQEAFLKAYRSRGRFRGEVDPRGWLKRIVVNAAIDVLRRRRAGPDEGPMADGVATDRPGPQAVVSEAERAEAVRAAVDELPAHQREVLLLREFGGLTYREIAEQLGLPRGTVESRVIRARERLREVLGRYVNDENELARGSR